MSTDKRSVSTDALETLGTIIDETAGRDAIHLVVEPVIASHELRPGDNVGFVSGGAGFCENPVGIVDPFLKRNVMKGEWFWLVVYPRQITSLRHMWIHPAFVDKAESIDDDRVANSKQWIVNFAESINKNYQTVMYAANFWLEYEDWVYDNSESYKAQWDKFPEFWKHYEIVTGIKVPVEKQESFFTCSC